MSNLWTCPLSFCTFIYNEINVINVKTEDNVYQNQTRKFYYSLVEQFKKTNWLYFTKLLENSLRIKIFKLYVF